MKKLLLFLSLFTGLLFLGNSVFAQAPTITYPGAPNYTFTAGATVSLTPTSTNVTGAFAAVTSFSTAGTNFITITYDAFSSSFIAMDNAGNLDRINASTGTITQLRTTTLSNNGQAGIITDASGNIYVSDNSNNVVYEFSNTGTLIRTISGINNGEGLAVDAANNVYVADSGTGDIYKIPTGTTSFTINASNIFLNGFAAPYGIVINTVTGDMYVSQNGGTAATRAIIKIAGAITGGTTKATLASGFTTPRNLTFDSFGDLFLADNTSIKMITTAGVVTNVITAGLTTPGQVDFDPAGNLYIADAGRVKKSVVSYYAITAGALPTGLTLDPVTGIISGSPTTVGGPTAVTITAKNTTSSTPIALNFTVSPVAITITASGPAKTYGTALTTGTSATNFSITSGTLVAGQSVTSVTLTPNAAGLSATTAAGAAYTVTPSLATGTGGFLASNYTITYVAFNGTITPKAITITATGPTKTYGTALTAGTSTINFTAPGTVAGESVTGVTLTPDAAGLSATTAAAATYTVTPSLATGAGGFSASNYAITYVALSGTVTQKTLTVTGLTPNNKPYDGLNTVTGFTGGTLVGVLPADAGLVTLSASGTFASVNVANNIAVTSTSTLGGAQAGNYILTQPGGLLANITQVALTITATGPAKTYGTALTAGTSTTNFSLTSGTLATGQSITGVTLTPNAAGLSATTAAGAAYTVTPSLATGTGGFLTSNYNITYVAFSGTVTAKAITITATGPTKTYGTALTAGASGANFTAPGTATGETVTSVTLTPNAAGLSATTAAGTAYTITPSLPTGTGGFLASNYTITFLPFSGTVTAKAITITATGPAKTYGTVLTVGTSTTNFTAPGTVAGETVTSVTLTPNAAGLSGTTAAGNAYTITPSLATGTGGFLASNYTITYTPFNSTVSKAPLTITANNQSKTYGSTFTFAGTEFIVSGLLNSDNATHATITSTGSAATATVSGSPYPIIPSAATGTGLTNYNITYVNGTMAVTTAALTITANNQTISVGVTTAFTVSYSGFVNGDTKTNLTTQPTATSTGNASLVTGTFPIVASGAVDPNYTYTYVPGTLTVTTAGANTFDWTGAVSTVWENPLNWDVNNVQQTAVYPGSVDNADIVDVGVNTAIAVIPTTRFPVMSAANLTIASLTFGNNNAPDSNTGGTLGLTVNSFTLAVTGAILQEHSDSGGLANSGTTGSGYTTGITTTLQGNGIITCTTFTVGDTGTLPDNGLVNSFTRVNIGTTTTATLSVIVSGDFVINSVSDNPFLVTQNSDGYASLGGGATLTINGTMRLVNNNPGGHIINSFAPEAKFAMDLNNTNSPVLNLVGLTAINIGTNGNASDTVDFNHPLVTPNLMGTVNYNATSGSQKIYTSADASFNTTPAMYSTITLINGSTKLVDGGTLSTSFDFNASGGAVNLNTNNTIVTVGGNWTNSAALTQGTGLITIDGNYNNTGTFTAGTGGVSFLGTAQSLFDNSATGTTFNNVTFGNSGAKTMTVGAVPGFFAVSSSGVLTMSGTATLATGGFLTLRSTASGSAAVAKITTVTPISGNVNVERYFQGGSTFIGGRFTERDYRIISSPVNIGTKVNGNNVYGLNYIVGATAGLNTTANSTTNAFITGCIGGNLPGGNPSTYVYREDKTPSNVTFTSGNYIGITDITNSTINGTIGASDGNSYQIPVGNGVFFFFRGNATNWATKTVAPGIAPENTVLTSVGVLNQGSITVNDWFTPTTGLSSNSITGYSMVGNPYASTIDWETSPGGSSAGGILTTNLDNSINEFNPVTQQFDTYSISLHAGTGNATRYIASGQGFFVHASVAGGAALTFTESAKAPASQNIGAQLFMGTPVAQGIVPEYFRLKLVKDTVNYSDILIGFNPTASVNYSGKEDAKYVPGSGPQSLWSFSADNVALAVNVLPLPQQGGSQTIRLNVSATASGPYTFQRATLTGIPAVYQVWLIDKFAKDSLNISKNTSYPFTINLSDTTTFGSNRFKIVIREDPGLALKLLTFTGTKASGGAQLAWTTANEQNYTNFTIQRSTDNGSTYTVLGGFISTGAGNYSFLDKNPPNGTDKYRLQLTDFNGTITYSNVVELKYSGSGDDKGNITVYPNPARNVINVVINANNASTGNQSELEKVNLIPGFGKGQQVEQITYGIKIITLMGNVVVKETSKSAEWQDNISRLAPGTYIIQVVNNKDQSFIGETRFIKL